MWWIPVVVIVALLVFGLAIFFAVRARKRNDEDQEGSNVLPRKRDNEDELHPGENWIERYHRHRQEAFGRRGEDNVFFVISKIAREHGGYAYENVAFEDGNGFSTEIDAVLICAGGFFVIEVKSNKGVIKGSLEEEHWTARKKEWQDDRTFRNPIMQNKGHINHLRRVMGKGAPQMTSLVIFPYAAITLLSSDTMNVVFTLFDAQDFILEKIGTGKYSKQTVDRFNDQFRSMIARNGISHEQHMHNLKKKYDA